MLSFKEWMVVLRRVKGFKKEEKTREVGEQVRKMDEILSGIAKAKTTDELAALLPLLPPISDPNVVLVVAMIFRDIEIRFESLEKRVSNLETEVYRGKPIC